MSSNDSNSTQPSRHYARALLIASFLPFCWLAMMVVHEFGHVVAAWSTGGTVAGVVLHPLAISRTDVLPNPRPLIVVWAGPLVGSVAPLILWLSLRAVRIPESFLARFFAGFCLVANGAYIGVGSFDRIGDAGTMLQHGSPTLALWTFGCVSILAGFALWHGQGRHFGMGPYATQVGDRAVVISGCLLGTTLALELILN